MTAPPVVIDNLPLNPRQRLKVALGARCGESRIELRVMDRLASHADAWTPTRDGFALDVAHLPAVARALIKAEAKARALGLIGGAP